MNKQHFTKVEALEEFTNLWSIGFYPKFLPMQNAHRHFTTPRPKFRNYTDNDTVGSDFSLRDHETHTSSPLMPATTLKPEDFHPPVKDQVQAGDELYENIYHGGDKSYVGKDAYDISHRTKFRL
jgi:hypothetical protein